MISYNKRFVADSGSSPLRYNPLLYAQPTGQDKEGRNMKLKNTLIIFCLSIVFIGCKSKEIDELKRKNESIEKDNKNLRSENVKLSNSIKVLERENSKLKNKEDEKNNFSSPEFVYDFKINTIVESIFKDFHYEFPEIINLDNVKKYTYDISKFSKDEKQFYENYVGCYLHKTRLTKEYLSFHLSEFYIKYIENDIVFWGFCKSSDGIHYNAEEKKFYDYDTFSTMPIENLSEYSSSYFDQNKYVKFTDYKIVENCLKEKKQKLNRKPLSKIEENKIREILIGFYSFLGQKSFNTLLDTYFITDINREKYLDAFLNSYRDLKYQNDPFEIYINTFFNDNIEDYDEDTIFVELKYGHSINYVSFAIKEINNQLKILKYNARYDEE